MTLLWIFFDPRFSSNQWFTKGVIWTHLDIYIYIYIYIYIKLRMFSLERKKKFGALVVIGPIFISMFHLRYPWRMKSNRSARLPIKVLNRFFGRWTLNIGSKTILTNDWSLSNFGFYFSCWRCLHILCWGWNFF